MSINKHFLSLSFSPPTLAYQRTVCFMRITSHVLNQIVSEKVASLTDFNKVVFLKESLAL
jgi:hypothetical protein